MFMFSILSTNIKNFKVEKVRFVSIHNLATVSKISLNGIENPRSARCGLQILTSEDGCRKIKKDLLYSN